MRTKLLKLFCANHWLACIAFPLAILFFSSCSQDDTTPTRANFSDAVKDAESIYRQADVEQIAAKMISLPNRPEQENQRIANALVNSDWAYRYKIHATQMSGNLGVVVIMPFKGARPLAIFARWTEPGVWKFFPLPIRAGNPAQLSHMGLSDSELEQALGLHRWFKEQIEQLSVR